MSESSPAYSVVIPAYEEAQQIHRCVMALTEQSVCRSLYEIIVVDDGSRDGTAAVAAGAGADVVLERPHSGVAAARNAGLAVAQGEVVLFTDADCEPSREWIARMVEPIVRGDAVGVKGTYRTRQTRLIARLVQLEFEIRYERMCLLPQIDFIDTYAAAYRRDVLVAAGGFDVHYPVPSAEDVDLSFRLAQRGHKLVFVPEAWVWHTHPTTLGRYLRRKARFGFWRALLYLRYPRKAGGDAHTDPMLKVQFGLMVLLLGALVFSLFWKPVWVMAAGSIIAFLLTTFPFVRWAWPRDRTVAVAWPGVTFLRVLVQGTALAVGLAVQVLRRNR